MAKKAKTEEANKRLALVRVRGEVRINTDTKDTLGMLHLRRANFCCIVDNRPQYKGMVNKVKDYIAWGEIDEKTLAGLLSKWARKSGDERLTPEDLKAKKFASFEDFAKKFLDFKAEFSDLGIKPMFRLHPPSKGHERAGIKLAYSQGGALGYRGAGINELIAKMAGLRSESKSKAKTKE